MAATVTVLSGARKEAVPPSELAEIMADLVERGWITLDSHGRGDLTAEGEAALLAFYNRTIQELMPGGYVLGWAPGE